jgi:predicted ABC-type ATPase
MTTAVESFLVLEKSLSNRILKQWERDSNDAMRTILAAVNRGDFETAIDNCDGLSMAPAATHNQRFTEFIGMQATIFGASRLTRGNPRSTVFVDEGAKQPEEVTRASEAMVDMLGGTATEDVCREAQKLITEERAAQQEEAIKADEQVRKNSTSGFVKRFTSSVRGNGKAFIDIGSSLHTSRLSAWGFTQEANFRGIKFYQVSEQLDSRTCPVCRTMHGRKFAVRPAQTKLETQMSVTDMNELKSIAPWPKQDRKSVKLLAQMSNSRLQQNGWDTPPYHPLCRGVLVPAGSLEEKLPTQPELGDVREAPLPNVSPDEIGVLDPHELPFTGSAAEYRDRFFVPGVTPDDVLARHDPSVAGVIRDYETRLKKRTSTHKTWQDSEGNWLPERVKLHNKIIDDVLNEDVIARATALEGEAPVMTILGGRGGSGKTFLTKGTDKKGKGAPVDLSNKVVLNSDEIKGLLPEYEGWNAGQVHVEGSYLLKRIEKIARQRRINVVLDTTMGGIDKATRTVGAYTEAGYTVEGYYMHLPRQEAAFRSVFRAIEKGEELRYVPIDIILQNLDNEDAFDALKHLFTRWGLWDNQVEPGALPRFVGGNNLPAGIGTP